MSFTKTCRCGYFGVHICRNADCVHFRAVLWPASLDRWYTVLSAAMSAMYCILSWTKKLQYKSNEKCYDLYRLDI